MKTMLTKMMKIAAAVLVATGATLSAFAEAVTDTNDVTAVVVGWQRAQEALGEQLEAAPVSVREYSGLGGTGTYYVVTLEGGGYVVTSGDTSLEPVLAYSKTGTWVDDVKRNPLMAMLEIDIAAAAGLAERSSAIKSGGLRLAAGGASATSGDGEDAVATQNAAKWARYKAGASKKGGIRLGASAPNSDLRVSPLIQSAWSQNGPRGTGPDVTPGGENRYTPGNVYCGCVATMAAQMMKFWEWPKGTNISAIANYYGSVTFTNKSYGTSVVNSWSVSEGFPDNIKTTNSSKSQLNPAFGGTYDWANMPNTTQSSLNDTQRAAIGKLTRDAGIACCMGYSNDGSGASGSIFAHRAADQFAYTSGQDVGGWNDANRDALLACLDAGIPCGIAVSHSSSGHAIIADGYGYNSSGTLYVHFNYGWGSTGPSDWYTPPSVGDYNSVNDIIVNVYPPYVSKYDRTIVSGRVFSNGAVQSGVTVTATNRETGFSTNVTSNTKGIYSFMLPRGYYTFTATTSGSSAKVEADVKLGVAGAGSNAKSGNIHGLDLNLGTAVTAPSVALAHRWSFTGNLNDSVGSSTATKIGSNVNLVDGKAVCTGNGAGQGSLNLGANLLNTDGATVEVWARQDEAVGNARVFEYGVNTSGYFTFTWSHNGDIYGDLEESISGGASGNAQDKLAPYALGVFYHISATFERQGDGSTVIRIMRRDAASGALLRASVLKMPNGIQSLTDPTLYLGRSLWNDADARATYDEVRVWQGVLTDAQLKASALAGPDANLSTLPWNASAVRYVAKAVWQGGTTAPTASSLASSANWSCTDQNGDAITGVPDHRSVVIIPNGSTAFTIPEGFTPNWRKLQIGSEGKATAQWGKKTYTQTSVSAQLDPTSADYTLQGDANVDELARAVAPSVQDAPAGLSGKQFRYDGWVYVTAAQAGRWAVSAYADDYAAFRLDDEWLAFTRAMDDGIRTAVADVPKGWHRFTIIIGDYYGGYGGCAVPTDHSCATPVTISIDGGNSIAFTSSNFQFGAPDRAAPVVTLSADCDWSGVGEVSLDSGAELDLNGHALTIDKMDSSFLGANIKDTAATPGTIAFAEGGAVNRGNITVQSTIKTAYATTDEFLSAEATFWLDASDTTTITTNSSGEVTRWNSRVGSNYAKQSTHYQGVAMPYPQYDATTYGIPTVDFGEAKTDGGWAGANLGMDLRLNETVPTKTVFWVARMKDAGNVAWMGISDFDTPFRRGGDGQYAMIPNAKFANFWNGQTVVADMANDHPPADVFCVYSAQMDDSATYSAEYLASQCLGLHSGGKQLSELIIFNRALGDEERTEITQYLRHKWAVLRAAPIAHRWSFNGTTDAENLTDSVGGVVGKKQYHPSTTTTSDGGTVSWSNGKAVLQGGAGTGHLNLGQGVLGTGDAVTLELWVTKDANASQWAYYFAYNTPNAKNLISLSANRGSTSSNTRNMIQTALNGTSFADGELTYLPTGETYHYSLTLQANGNGGTIMRWMARDAATGLLVGDVTKTASSWTLAANASDWSLTLGDNPWVNSTYDNPSSYDEVRVWNGILGDEQLSVNAIVGPDASPDAAVTSSEGFALATNATFNVNSDYDTLGTVILSAGSKLQFNGPYVFTAHGGISIPSGELADYIVADASLYNVIVNGDVITVTSKAGSASWTGAGRAGDVTDPNNWDCRDGFNNELPGELPSSGTAVTVSGAGIDLQVPAGTTLQCASFTIQDCTLTADCDWRGLAVTPSITGTADLNGHNLRLNHLTANVGSALANSGAGVSGVMFDATAGNYNESSYVDGLSNLGTSENAHVIILNASGDSVSTLNIGNTANKWTEVRMVNGTFASTANPSIVGYVSDAHGILTVDGATVTFNSLKGMNGNLNGSATVNVKSGSLILTGYADYGNGSNGTATFNLSGGTFETRGALWAGRTGSGTATFNMTAGSTFNLKGDFRLGSAGSSKGIFNQSGGTVNATGSNGINFGYDSNTWGKYYQTGGTFNTTRTLNLRRAGSLLDIGGTVNATANGVGVNIATTSGSSGEVFIREGGVLNTSFLKKYTGTAHATFDGGTIKAHDTNNAGTFISGIGDVKYTAKGLTVDTNGKNVSMVNNTVTLAVPGSALNKAGSGTLTVDALPSTDGVNVNVGTLALSANCDNTVSSVLAHRWSFNGTTDAENLTDSVGGVEGKMRHHTGTTTIADGGTVNWTNGKASLPGGNGAGYLNLGQGVLGTGNAVTLELWVTKDVNPSTWAYLFAYNKEDEKKLITISANLGSSSRNNINKIESSLGFNYQMPANNPAVIPLDGTYHYTVTFCANESGGTVVRWVIHDAATGLLKGDFTYTANNWTLADATSWSLTLGSNPWLNNTYEMKASYDEVRVWNTALSDEAIAISVNKGPNASDGDIAAIATASSRTLKVASGATLDLGGHTLTQPRLTGVGTVQNGTLDVGTLTPGGDGTAGTIALNVTSVSGVIRIDNGDAFTTTTAGLDLSGATIDLAFTPTASYTVATATGSGSFGAGRPALTVNGAPIKGWMVKKAGNTLKVSKGGVMLIAK